MELIIKIYDNFTDIQPKEQIEVYNSLEIREDLTSYSYCDLTIPIFDWINELDIVRIYEIQNTDKLLFEGYIDILNPWLEEIKLNIKDYKSLLKRKGLVTDKNYTNQTPKQIIDDLISYYNWLGDNWVCISSVSTQLNKEYKIGDNIYDIINEIAQELQKQWIIYWTTIYFADLVWDDYTSWVDYTEIVYDYEDFAGNNITNIELIKYGDIANIIVWVDQTWNKEVKTDSTSITNYWPLFESINVRDWDLGTITQAYLDFKKTPQKLFNLNTDFTLDLRELFIWDKVAVRIENVNSYLDYEWDGYIISKTTSIQNATKVINYNISTATIQIKDFIQRMRDIESSINYLSIK